MKKSTKRRGARGFKRLLFIESTSIVIGAVCVFELVEYFFNVVMHGYHAVYDPVLGVGVILPMGAIMWLLSRSILKASIRYMTLLTDGITKVANGDFGARLDERLAGPLRDVFADFNRMIDELAGVQTLRDDFVNQFSHEFKTPIMSINGFASMLLEDGLSSDDRRKYLEIIASESARLASLSGNTILLSKLESMQLIANRHPYSLDEQLRRSAIILSPQWEKKGIDLSAELEPVDYEGNADLMQEVWLNLIGNAVKFTPDGGSIRVGLRAANGWIEVSVSDTGRGMTEEELARAFEKYYQGRPSGSAKGLGLGLAIAKKIVSLCGGRIEALSVGGEGSTFTVFLPVPGYGSAKT